MEETKSKNQQLKIQSFNIFHEQDRAGNNLFSLYYRKFGHFDAWHFDDPQYSYFLAFNCICTQSFQNMDSFQYEILVRLFKP